MSTSIAPQPPPNQPASNPNGSDKPVPALPNIRMLDPAALEDLLFANLSPPEITSIILFAANGAIFGHATPFNTRALRSLAATYGAAYDSYATTSEQGNLTGVNATAHPSSYVTTPSEALLPQQQQQQQQQQRQRQSDSDSAASEGSAIAFDDGKNIAVVTSVAERILLAVIGPCKLDDNPDANADNEAGYRRNHSFSWFGNSPRESQRTTRSDRAAVTASANATPYHGATGGLLTPHDALEHIGADGAGAQASSAPNTASGLLDRLKAPTRSRLFGRMHTDKSDDTSESTKRDGDEDGVAGEGSAQEGADGEDANDDEDLERLAGLNLSAPPQVLLALESKSAAMGKFLATRLRGLVCPDDF